MPTLPQLRALLDSEGKPICDSAGLTICGNCYSPEPCCLCDNNFAFAFTGDGGTFDPTGGQTAIVLSFLFDTCQPFGVFQFTGRATIGGNKVCYSYWIPVFLSCFDYPPVSGGTPGEIYFFYSAPNIVTATCDPLDGTSTFLYAYFDSVGFYNQIQAGHVTWDCSAGSWVGSFPISFTINWTDPCTSTPRTVTVNWTVEITRLNYIADPVCGNVPAHANTFVRWCDGSFTCRFVAAGGFEMLGPGGNTIEINSDAITSDETGLCCAFTPPCICWSLPPAPAPPPPDEANCCPGRTNFGLNVTAAITGVAAGSPFLPGCDECLNGTFPMMWTWDVGGSKPGWIGFFHMGSPCIDGNDYRFIRLRVYCADGINWVAQAEFATNSGIPEDIFIETDLIVPPCSGTHDDNYFEVALNMNPGTNCSVFCPCYGGAYVIVGP